MIDVNIDVMLEIFEQFPKEFPVFVTSLSAFVAFLLGILWYNPKIMGEKYTQALAKENIFYKAGLVPYIVALIMWFISASVYSFLAKFLEPDKLGTLLGLSTFLWVGLVLPSSMISGLFSGKKIIVMAVDSSYYLAGLYMFAAVHFIL